MKHNNIVRYNLDKVREVIGDVSVFGVSILHVSMIFLLDFETFKTVWYCLPFNLLSLFCKKKKYRRFFFFTVDKFYYQATFSILATTNACMKQHMIYLEFTFPGL